MIFKLIIGIILCVVLSVASSVTSSAIIIPSLILDETLGARTSSFWKTTGSVILPNNSTRDVAVGGSTSGTADLFVDVSASTVYINGRIDVDNASTTNLSITSITGSTQCLQVSSDGTVSGAGSACSSASGNVYYGGANAIAYYESAGTTATGTVALVWNETTKQLTVGTNDTATGTIYLYGDAGTGGGRLRFYNGADDDGTEEWWQFTPAVDGNTEFNLGIDENLDLFTFYNSGNFLAEGNISGNTYASDASVSDTELKYINSLSSNAQTQISGKLSLTGGAVTGKIDVGSGELEIPNGASMQTGTAGEIAIDTTDNQLQFFGTATTTLMGTFRLPIAEASSTLAYYGAYGSAGTTTMTYTSLGDPWTISSIAVSTDTGTTSVSCGDGTNWMGFILGGNDTGYTSISPSADNSFTADEDLKCRIGTQTGDPNDIKIRVMATWDVQ